jgi:phage terminase large subunit-like protein
MNIQPSWSTACPDWEERIVDGRSLIPFDPLFPEEAKSGLGVFHSMRLVSLPGRPMIGEVCRPWTTALAAAFFGSYDAAEGVRYINDFHLDIAKKNIKSTLAAALMVTCLIRNWRESGEFYILAPTKEIADNSFFPARDMIRADPALAQILHIQENQRIITHRNTRAFLKVIAADSETVGGKKTIGLLIDELWLFGKRAGSEAMFREAKGGLASHPEGFVISASTKPDGPPAGVYLQRLDYFRGVRDGKIDDPSALGILYEYPKKFIKDESYKKPEFFYIPNPNLGASVSERYLLAELGKAERGGRASLVNFFAKHLNVEPGMALRSDGWAGAAIWSRGVEAALTLDTLLERSEVVTVGIDGGGLDDLLGVAVVGRERETGRWLCWAHGLISTIGVWRRKANAEDYLRFKKAGELTVFRFGRDDEDILEKDDAVLALLEDVPAAAHDPNSLPLDIQFVVDLVARVRDAGLLAQVGVDAAGIGAIVDALAKIEVTQDANLLEGVRQGIGLMGAIKTVERMLADRRFRHGDQALLTWCVGNLRIVQTATAMRAARDETGYGKIDPAMALFNAVALMSMNPEAENESSVYSADRGLIVFG